MELKEISINKIKPNPLQPREHFPREKLKELANSIKEADLLQPIVVRELDGKYEIVAGERRWKAHQILKSKTIPVIIWKAKDDIEALEKSLIENLHRDDLISVERENAVYDLWKSGRYKTYEELGKKLALRERTIENLLLAKKQREEISMHAVEYEKISTRTILDTAGLETEEKKKLLKSVIKGDIGTHKVREVTSLVKKAPSPIKRDLLEGHITPEEAEASVREYEQQVPTAVVKEGEEYYESVIDDMVGNFTQWNRTSIGWGDELKDFDMKAFDKVGEQKKMRLVRSAIATARQLNKTSKRIKEFTEKKLLPKLKTKLKIDWG